MRHPDAPTHGTWHRDPDTGQVIHIDSHSPVAQETIDALLLISRAFTVQSASVDQGVQPDARHRPDHGPGATGTR